MYETLKEQYASGKSFSMSQNNGLVTKGPMPNYFGELYPVSIDYYHELNPYFVDRLPRYDFLGLTPVFTVRDGLAPFGDFLVRNLKEIEKSNNLFIINPEFAPLIPENLVSHFCTWHFHQYKVPDLKHMTKVLIFGLVCDQYLGKIEDVENKLAILKTLPAEVEVEILLPLRKNPFDLQGKEIFLHYQVLDLIRKTYPEKEFRFLKSSQATESVSSSGVYLLDLNHKSMVVSDNYLSYAIASKGGRVSTMSLEKPRDAIFEITLSLHHKMSVLPLPKVESRFFDILYAHKQGGRNALYDPIFQKTLLDATK